MSDTRAAIRELRSLSEKRSLSALSEPEAARWMALRRQLGLPAEPAGSALAQTPSDAVTEVAVVAPAEGRQVEPALAPPVEAPAETPAPEVPDRRPLPGPTAGESKEPDRWAGPSLDHPVPPGGASWVGPSLDAPAWSDAAAERPTDPGLDEPPPTPFDEAPAARPRPEPRAIELNGAPDEPLKLAAPAEFITYAREGNESIELPVDSGAADSFELASAFDPTTARTAEVSPAPGAAAVEVPFDVPPAAVPRAPDPLPLEMAALSETPVEGGGAFSLTPVPAALETRADAAEGAIRLTAAPIPLETLDGLPGEEGAIPLTPVPLPEEALPEAQGGEGAIPLTPVPISTEGLHLEAPAEEPAFEPEEKGTAEAISPEAPAPSEEAAGFTAAGPPTPVSTWAPGSSQPPVLGAEQFAASGDFAQGGLDPWPESVPNQTPAEEAVETIGDEDLVEEMLTPTPTPLPFPVAVPPGSGGIRGFQFPRPPTGPVPVPVPPSPPSRPRTETNATFRTPLPSTGHAPTTPAPQGPRAVPPPASPLAVPPAPPPQNRPPAAVASSTPLPTARSVSPVPAATTAPVTPPPAAATRPVPLRTPTPPPQRIPTPPSASPARPSRPAPPPRPPPSLQPVAAQDEGALPLLELVDEVEPPRQVTRAQERPPAAPAAGTGEVFGPPMMLNPSFVEGEHRVVIHTLEGQVHRGTVHDLDLQDDVLPLQQPDGRLVRIPARRLKAVFFVLAPGGKPLPTRGERVQVTFRDGRQVVGYSEDHNSGDPGFFVVPSDARTNTARVYVFRGGVQSITTG